MSALQHNTSERIELARPVARDGGVCRHGSALLHVLPRRCSHGRRDCLGYGSGGLLCLERLRPRSADCAVRGAEGLADGAYVPGATLDADHSVLSGRLAGYFGDLRPARFRRFLPLRGLRAEFILAIQRAGLFPGGVELVGRGVVLRGFSTVPAAVCEAHQRHGRMVPVRLRDGASYRLHQPAPICLRGYGRLGCAGASGRGVQDQLDCLRLPALSGASAREVRMEFCAWALLRF